MSDVHRVCVLVAYGVCWRDVRDLYACGMRELGARNVITGRFHDICTLDVCVECVHIAHAVCVLVMWDVCAVCVCVGCDNVVCVWIAWGLCVCGLCVWVVRWLRT